jgi:hypothetical protein
MVKAIEGGSPIYLGKIAAPRFPAAWKELRANLERVILSNAKWAQTVPLFLNEIEAEAAEGSVSVSVYSSFNFPMTLFFTYGTAIGRDALIWKFPWITRR